MSSPGASGRSPRALAERRVRTPWVAFPDAGCDAADVLRRLEGAIERIFRVAPGCALYFVTKFLRSLNESSQTGEKFWRKESELIIPTYKSRFYSSALTPSSVRT